LKRISKVLFHVLELELQVVRELTLSQTKSGRQVLAKERSLDDDFEKSLVNSLLVSSFGFRESSLLL
jgi:hypothetical protein